MLRFWDWFLKIVASEAQLSGLHWASWRDFTKFQSSKKDCCFGLYKKKAFSLCSSTCQEKILDIAGKIQERVDTLLEESLWHSDIIQPKKKKNEEEEEEKDL